MSSHPEQDKLQRESRTTPDGRTWHVVDRLAMAFEDENVRPTMTFWGELSEWERQGATVEVYRDQLRQVSVFTVWMPVVPSLSEFFLNYPVVNP